MMNYQESIHYLFSRLPMFSSQGQTAIKPGLTNIIRFCRLLNDPQKSFRSVHIGGTNGKGSTSHMVAAILQSAGYKTGLYTSPHLRDFRERIRVNGEMISEEEVISFVDRQKKNIEDIEPSFFETTVAMAFEHFVKHQVQIAVIEVGLGGRLDSTNIIMPELSVITNIGLDHVNILGDTLRQIAFEKAGIIKSGIPVVIGERQELVEDVFKQIAAQSGSPIVFASDEWKVEGKKINTQKKDIEMPDTNMSGPELLSVTVFSQSADPKITKSSNFKLDLTGSYQLKNFPTVLSSIEQLRMKDFIISEDHIRLALSQVTKLTGLMGRWQTLSTSPLVICDTGHNEDGIREVLKNIASTPFEHLHMVIGMVKDKDISRVLQLLPKNATYYFCQPDIPRAKEAEMLASEAHSAGLTGNSYGSVRRALEAARQNACSRDLVFVGGSTFVVAEII